jgi:thymidylate synthase (FAD)
MANLCVEVSTTRDIARQILRHRSFSFQEFSQRYSVVPELLPTCARRQDTKNRQNSFNDLDPENLDWFARQQQVLHDNTLTLYSECLSRGIAKESCRFLLPGSAQTFLAVNGTIRSWIHYLLLRADPTSGTQLEHLELAQTIREKIVQTHLPITYKLLHPSCGVKS